MLKAITFLIFMICFSNQIQANSNKAAVSWVLFNDRKDFVYADKKLHNRFLEDFGVPQKNISKLDVNSTEDAFSQSVSDALAKIKDSAKPELVIMIDSHGLQGQICRPKSEMNISHASYIKRLVKSIQKAQLKKPLSLHVMYSACFAGSLVDEFKKAKIPDGVKAYVYAASDSNQIAIGNLFGRKLERSLLFLGKNPEGEKFYDVWSTLNNGRTFLKKDGASTNAQTITAWTNDSAISQAPKNIDALIEMVLHTNNPHEVSYAMDMILRDTGSKAIMENKLAKAQGQRKDDLLFMKLLFEEPKAENAKKLMLGLEQKKWSTATALRFLHSEEIQTPLLKSLQNNVLKRDYWLNLLFNMSEAGYEYNYPAVADMFHEMKPANWLRNHILLHGTPEQKARAYLYLYNFEKLSPQELENWFTSPAFGHTPTDVKDVLFGECDNMPTRSKGIYKSFVKNYNITYSMLADQIENRDILAANKSDNWKALKAATEELVQELPPDHPFVKSYHNYQAPPLSLRPKVSCESIYLGIIK